MIWIILLAGLQAPNQVQAWESEEMQPGAVSGPDGSVYTLGESIKRALSVNPRIKAAEAAVRKAESAVGSQRGEFFPTFSAQSYVEDISSVHSTGPADEDYIDQQIDVVNLRFSQTLFDGLKIFNKYQKSILNKELARARRIKAERDLALDVQVRFLKLLKAREDVKSLKDAVERLKVGVSSAEAFFEKEMLPYSEVLQARVELADARQQLSQAENQAETLEGELNILLGFSAARGISYKGELERAAEPPGSMQECLDYAYEHRPQMLIAEKSIKMAEKEKAIALGDFSPRLSANADYYYRDDDYSDMATNIAGEPYDRDQSNTYWTVSLRLQWDFGLGGQQFYRSKEVLHEIERLRQKRLETKNQISSEVRTQFLNLREADGRIGSTRTAVEAAEEGYARAKKRSEVRMGTISELLDAQARLSRAEANYNRAIADYLLSLARLNHAMGRKDFQLVPGKKGA